MRRTWPDGVLVGAVALLANMAYLALSSGDFFFPDSATYLTPALQLLAGHGFVSSPGVAETLRTPGYPLFLLPFLAAGLHASTIVVMQHLLEVALAVGVYLFMRERLGRRAGLIGAFIFALDLPSIHIANKVLSETLFTALLFALVLVAMRLSSGTPAMRWFVAAGILAGLLVLVRPVAILYFVLLSLFLGRNRRRGVAVFLALALFFPLGWALRNRARTGIFTISSVTGVNMLLHRAAGSIAILDGEAFTHDLAARQEEVHRDADEEIETRLGIDDAEELSDAIRCDWYRRIGERIALEHPVGLMLLTARGVLVNLFESDWEAAMLVSSLPSSIVELAVEAWTHFVMLLVGAGFLLLWQRDRRLALLLAGTIAYFLLIAAGSEAEYRFRVPVMPLMAIAAGVALDGFWRALEA